MVKDTLRMLALPVRRQIVEHLVDHGEANHAEMAEALHRPLGVWHHLQAMVQAGLLRRVEVSRRDIRYVLIPTPFASLADYASQAARMAEGGEGRREVRQRVAVM
jgi:DNA-binding transcriptional ArsR family regulator